ncbi:hypothetical protein BDW02DRAFT_575107 [Decorospora gaudefroyi]|uniref:Core Histone H2A/H2B/H3 domain-containing protein n=1 Tax=Decorospora gaudefroyi TaxID=184978 RepID=A0A6A5JW88_9PLEO|nr:hypothetical protein BDW02DRAFT_575107 [Decorospora gaudefroyi]
MSRSKPRAKAAPAKQTARKSTGGKVSKKNLAAKANRKTLLGKRPLLIHPCARKKRHFKPGTVALREIRKYQKELGFMLRKLPFSRVVREITNNIVPDLRF